MVIAAAPSGAWRRSRSTLRRRVALLVVATAVAAGGGASQARAQAGGLYHVYGCRTPAGMAAPTDGWTSLVATGLQAVANTCAQGGALVGEIPSTALQPAEISQAGWLFTAPPQTRLYAADLWRTGTATNVMGYLTYTSFWLAAPEVVYDSNDVFDRCLPDACTALGDPNQPFAVANEVQAPATSIRGQTTLGIAVGCYGDSGQTCPESANNGTGPPSGEFQLFASDITLADQSIPIVTSVSNGLTSDAPLTGLERITFSASDAGPGLYQVNFLVDGHLVTSVPVDTNGGHCVPATPAPADGTNAFLYGQPCDASANVTDTFDTTQVTNGMHELLVQVTDASGTATTVLDRKVLFANEPGAGAPSTTSGPSAPNGTNASPTATLHLRWKHSKKAALTSQWGQVRQVTGTLTTAAGQPIGGATLTVQALPQYAGAHTTALGQVRTSTSGAFTFAVGGDASSRSLTFSYDAHLGDRRAAASATLTLLVHAGLHFSVSPHVTAVGHTITFTGKVLGTPIPDGGKQLVLEARAPGSEWIQFQVVRTDARGRFGARYRFRFPGPATYQFRAVSEFEADFPFLGGSSNVVSVFEH